MRAVAAGHELTVEGRRFAVSVVRDARLVILDAFDSGRLDLEPDLAAVSQSLIDQILDDFLLAIDGDPATG